MPPHFAQEEHCESRESQQQPEAWSSLALSSSPAAQPTTAAATTAARSTGIVTVQNNEPQNPLIPANTNEVGGGLVLQNIFAGLVYYNGRRLAGDTTSAESIESDDNQNWTITLKEGLTFTDGTAVTAESFVKAWQYAASDADVREPVVVQRLRRLHRGLQLRRGRRQGDTLALEVVDDTTFTVELAAPQADFPLSPRLPGVLPAARVVLRRPGGLR